jgi:hypothetical protein
MRSNKQPTNEGDRLVNTAAIAICLVILGSIIAEAEDPDAMEESIIQNLRKAAARARAAPRDVQPN